MIVIEERKICRMLEGLFQFDKECEWNDAIEEAMHRFVILPTIDAEPVIRCKDCDWWTKQEASLQGRCERYGIYPTGEWYCAAARLKENKKISNIETCMNCKHRVRNQYAASLPPKYKCTLLNRYVTLENRCEKFEMERGKFDEKE